MKCVSVLLIFSLSLLLGSCKNKQETASVKEATPVVVEEDKPYLEVPKEIDFGKIRKKEVPLKTIAIEIANIGNAPLVIMKTDVACGCMTISHTKQPIQKGEKGYINLEINTTNQDGFFNKPVFVKSNAQNEVEIIRIKGHIQ